MDTGPVSGQPIIPSIECRQPKQIEEALFSRPSGKDLPVTAHRCGDKTEMATKAKEFVKAQAQIWLGHKGSSEIAGEWAQMMGNIFRTFPTK